MIEERKKFEKQLIQELKESASKILEHIKRLELAPKDSEESLSAYSDLMAYTLQVQLDAEAVLEVNEEIMKLELAEPLETA